MVCPQALIVHADGSGSCAVVGCLDHDTLIEAVSRHRSVVNCRAALGSGCAVCHRSPTVGGENRPTAEGDGMCVGVAVVSADGTMTCSVPGCAPGAWPGGWLARHADIRHTDIRHTDIGHTDIGHTDIGHADIGHTDIGHTDIGHTDIGDADTQSGGDPGPPVPVDRAGGR